MVPGKYLPQLSVEGDHVWVSDGRGHNEVVGGKGVEVRGFGGRNHQGLGALVEGHANLGRWLLLRPRLRSAKVETRTGNTAKVETRIGNTDFV